MTMTTTTTTTATIPDIDIATSRVSARAMCDKAIDDDDDYMDMSGKKSSDYVNYDVPNKIIRRVNTCIESARMSNRSNRSATMNGGVPTFNHHIRSATMNDRILRFDSANQETTGLLFSTSSLTPPSGTAALRGTTNHHHHHHHIVRDDRGSNVKLITKCVESILQQLPPEESRQVMRNVTLKYAIASSTLPPTTTAALHRQSTLHVADTDHSAPTVQPASNFWKKILLRIICIKPDKTC